MMEFLLYKMYAFLELVLFALVALTGLVVLSMRSRFFKVRARPGPLARRCLPWMPFVVLLVSYQTTSYFRHLENPRDVMVPGLGEIVFEMWELTFAPIMVEDFENSTYDDDGKVIEQRYLIYFGKRDDTNPEAHMLLEDMKASGFRFFSALVILYGAVYVGLHMGTLPHVDLILYRFIISIGMVPMMAVLPILLIFLGLGEVLRISLIVLGSFFYLTLAARQHAKEVPDEHHVLAFTQAASDFEVVHDVVLPQVWPGALGAMRLAFPVMITLLLVSEQYGPAAGMGYRVFKALRWKAMDTILCYVIIMTVLLYLLDLSYRLWMRFRYQFLTSNS